MKIEKKIFGILPTGEKVFTFLLKNSNGMEAEILNYGGIIRTLKVSIASDELLDVVHGCDTLEDYLAGTPYFGAIVGRYANRIANGKFELNGKVYELAQNNNKNALHGGIIGFDKVVWQAEEMASGLKLSYFSKDGEEGFPGNLWVEVSYSLLESNAFKIDYKAKSDAPTVINFTNHSYFNLAEKGNVLAHELQINANFFLPVNQEMIPTGEIKSIANTAFDFTEFKQIGEKINDFADPQIALVGGYDHSFVVNESKEKLKLAVQVFEPLSGRRMQVYTTEPAVQLYVAKDFNGVSRGKSNTQYQPYSAFCLETQHFPDSPNQPNFPSTVLKPDEVFESTTVYQFNRRI